MSRAEYDQYNQRQRDDLFAGAQRQPTVGEQAASAYRARQQMSNQELLQEAQTTHEDTTARLQKGVQLVEDARRMQEATNKALYDQSRQIQQTQQNMHKMKEDVRYSEKLLAFMRRCCCCACCGDPEKAKEKEWAARTRYDQPVRDELPPPPPMNTTAQKAAGPVAQKYRDAAYPTVDTRGLREVGYGAEAEAIDANTKQQDRYLDEISAGLEALHRGALVQKAELERQDPQINTMLNQADELNYRVRDMNQNSQLRKYR